MSPAPGGKPARRIAWPAVTALLSLAAYVRFPLLADWLGSGMRIADAAEPLRLLLGGATYFSMAWLAGRLVSVALERSASERRRPPRLLQELITVALFLAASLATIILISGQSMTGALASSGLLVAVLGFALRNVIADVFSGVALGLEAPYRIGDWVAIDGVVKGRIVEVGWRTTRLQTPDQTYMILPNSQIAQQRLVNYSAPRRHYRAQIPLVLDHSVPITEAKRLMTSAAATANHVLKEPAPDVRVLAYDASGITYAVRYWVPSFADDLDCRDAVLSAVDAALREQNMPAPRTRIAATLENFPVLSGSPLHARDFLEPAQARRQVRHD